MITLEYKWKSTVNDMKETMLLDSLHHYLGVDIKVLDLELKEVAYYHKAAQSRHTDTAQLKISIDDLHPDKKCFIFTKALNEVIILYRHHDFYYLFGPFKVAEALSDQFIEILNQECTSHVEVQGELVQYINKRDAYALDDLKHIFKFIRTVLGINTAQTKSASMSNEIDVKKTVSSEIEAYWYMENEDVPKLCLLDDEDEMMRWVQAGAVEQVKRLLAQMNKKYFSLKSRESLRSEKNYSILLFEKLSHIAVELGLSMNHAKQYRNQLMVDSEEAKFISEVMKIRNAAFIFFTKKIRELLHPNLSPFLKNILNYIHHHLYQEISLEKIAYHFNVSQTTLNLVFKNELGITVKKYIIRQKIEDAKRLLRENLSISEISQMLGFADSSHFCKNFKHEMGVTPTVYRRTIKK